MENLKAGNKEKSNRREFIKRTFAGGLLIGNAFRPGTCLAQQILKPESNRYQSVHLNTHEYYGDIEERLDLPRDWQVTFVHNGTYEKPVLSRDDIRKRLQNPIGTQPLREIAAGKKTAVILFDDLSRPTPAHIISPLIIEELKAGGIKDENILFMCMLGTHRAITNPEVRAKLGDNIVDHYPWINHNCFDNCTNLGTTRYRTVVKINHYFLTADVKVSISGLKKHGHPGYSGGAKAVIPGVAHLDTIQHFHTNTLDGRFGAIYNNRSRDNMEEIARMAGLDFTVQNIVNGKRQPIGVHAGDVRDAFRSGVPEAIKLQTTHPVSGADVVISNGYPMALHEWGAFDWANMSLREGGTAVVILQTPLARGSMHYFDERMNFTGKSFWEDRTYNDPVRKAGQIIILSQYLQHRDMHYTPGRVKLVRTWEDVLALLEKSHGPSTNVAIYPYIGVQHEPVELDDA